MITLHPFIDNEGILRLSGRIGHSNLPIILHGNHQITKMIVRAEHLHAWPMMLASSIGVRLVAGRSFVMRPEHGCLAGDTQLDLSLKLWVNFRSSE